MNLFELYFWSQNPILFVLVVILVLFLFVGLIALGVYIGMSRALKKVIVSSYIVNKE